MSLRFWVSLISLMLITGCGVTANIASLLGKTPLATVSPGPTVSVDNTLDLSALTPATGKSPFTFEVVNGDATISGSTLTPGTTPGDVLVKITDGDGTETFIKIPVTASLDISPKQLTLSTNSSYTYTANHGVPPYTFSATGGTITTGGVFTPDGSLNPATVTITDSLANSVSINITVNPALSSSLNHGVIAANNSATLTGSGGVPGYSYSLVSGPGSIGASTGTYTSAGGTGTVTLRVTDSLGNTFDRTLTVNPVLAASPASARLLTSTLSSFSATGGVPPYTYTMGVGSTGTISLMTGSYTAPNTASADTVIITDSLGNTATSLVDVVTSVSLAVNRSSMPPGVAVTFTASNGFPPYTYSIVSGGGSIDAISGVYSASTSGSKTIAVTDSLSMTSQMTITVYEPLAGNAFAVGIGDTATVTYTGGVPPVSASILSGAGSVSGLTFTAPGTAGTTTLRLTDSDGNVADTIATITPPPSFTSFSVNSPFTSANVSVTMVGANYDSWCLRLNVNSTDGCTWQTGPLPTSLDITRPQKLYKDPKSYYAFLKRGNSIAAASDHKIFNSKFPLGSPWAAFDPKYVFAHGTDLWVYDAATPSVRKFDKHGNVLFTIGEFGSFKGMINPLKGLASDSAGNLYVGDNVNRRVQKFSPTGAWLMQIPATPVGSTENGYFNDMREVAVDSAGNVYVADGRHIIQKFNSVGEWQANIGSSGTGDGQFINIEDIKIDSAGNIFVADTGNHRVQKIGPSGTFLMKFGSNGTGNGQFSGLKDLFLDSSGDILVLDESGLQRFSSTGTWLSKQVLLTSPTSFPVYVSSFTIDSEGTLVVADSNLMGIVKFDGALNPTPLVRRISNDDGHFYILQKISVDASQNIWVAESHNHRIQQFDNNGDFLMKVGSNGTGDGQFQYPGAIAVTNDGSFFVADNGNRIQKFDAAGNWQRTYPIGMKATALALDSAGQLYFTSTGSKIRRLNPDTGVVTEAFDTAGTPDSGFFSPAGISIDSSNNFYIASDYHVLKFSPTGTFLFSSGGWGSTSGKFSQVLGDAAVSPNGDIIAADQGGVAHIFSSTGAFKATISSSGLGRKVNSPRGIAVDSAGNIYISDSTRNQVLKFSPAGVQLFD
ncbi:hypothetical protein AZI87_15785 [Bdellovibrio bacteriovorus]|uniref:Uncharacterized protein n=1 Tax=Bdellovibrio bacteriovorus TaxID=959 RepID=A0A162FY14_BDEBC|nr:NHL repeat-containing protein [Bdellovibrio bacteriovorus]KYG62742.1 hypothetical protein AZI87_15785 [Bdellovibrio bacteriovorus]